MPNLFEENSDSDVEVKTNNEYAKNYEIWRKKEELNKLKTKYGDDDFDEESSSSEDDDEAVKLSEDVEKDFFKTLSCLKNKDPKIYDQKAVFFKDTVEPNKKHISKQEKSMSIKDYERKLLLENGGIVDEDVEDENLQNRNETYFEEQQKIKENLKSVIENIEDSNDNEWGGLFKARSKTKEEKAAEEADYKAWLAGQKQNLEDKETEASLKHLKEYWNDPNLDDGEKFLKDYILKKRFLERDDEDYIPSYEEIVHDSDENLSGDEYSIKRQEEFEQKYNFRFEEPDDEFIKRYPRTMEHSLRKQDERRKIKRIEVKERKQQEKEEKFKEIRKLKELKLKEIQEKIEMLKEITGNDELPFNNDDIEGDFDPEEYDKKMQSIFNKEYYSHPEEDQKPKFNIENEYIDEIQTENFDDWNPEIAKNEYDHEPHCEDDDFNMDADYDPTKNLQQELIDNTKKKKKRKRKSKFVEMMSKPKPSFDIYDKSYEEYLDEYYKLDCEDIIDNIPCRFKYREVIPNSFGLTTEEILTANDRELNKWCSLKKAVQIRPEHVETYDQIAYSKKAQNLHLKRKILPSLFKDDKEQNNEENLTNKVEPNESTEENATGTIKQSKKQQKRETLTNNVPSSSKISLPVVEKKAKKQNDENLINNPQSTESTEESTATKILSKKKNKSENKNTKDKINDTKSEDIQDVIKLSKKKRNKKNKSAISQEISHTETNNNMSENVDKDITNHKETKSKKRKNQSLVNENPKKHKRMNKAQTTDSLQSLSDARLTAYGINPKIGRAHV